MDMMDSWYRVEHSALPCVEWSEDKEDWRSELSVSEITEMDRACVETEAICLTCFEL